MKQSRFWRPDTYQPGDIVRVANRGIEARASQLVFSPHSIYLHHFLIGNYIPKENDYVIYEAIPSKGVAIGRLSMYDGQAYSVLRLAVGSQMIGKVVVDDVSLFGRAAYNYIGILRLLIQGIRIECRQWQSYHRFKAITARDVTLGDKGLLCTQLVVDAYLAVGVAILPPGEAALPCAFEDAIAAGILVEVTL